MPKSEQLLNNKHWTDLCQDHCIIFPLKIPLEMTVQKCS